MRIRGGGRVLAIAAYIVVEFACSFLLRLVPGGRAAWDLAVPVYDVVAVYLLTRVFRATGEGSERRPRWRMTGYAPASFVLALLQAMTAASEVLRLVGPTDWHALARSEGAPVWAAWANSAEGLVSSLLLAALYAGSWWRLWRSVTSGPSRGEPAVWLPGALPRAVLSRRARADLGPLIGAALPFVAQRVRDGDPVLPIAVATTADGALRFVDPTIDAADGPADADALRERCLQTLRSERASLRATSVVTATRAPDGAALFRFDLEHADGSAVTAVLRATVDPSTREPRYGELGADRGPALVQPGGTAPVVDAAV
ncbi:hypothetical protein DEI82_02970 [Curtobacterium sp. MCBD17_019]|nr:hypothetical protein DEI82_02970 [Curtobacterium sp. MCBD17_019]